MNRASVAVIGGGVVGASVAYHLALRGVQNVLVLDRSTEPGKGSTGKATGGFRAQFDTPVNVRLSLLAREKLFKFRDEIGNDAGYDPVGYLWIARTEECLERLRAALAVQRSEGLAEAKEIDPTTASRINPAVAMDGIIGATWCPTDGFIKPLEMLKGYLSAAQRLGAAVMWGVEVFSVTAQKKGSMCILATSEGRIEADSVVNAAGAWAGLFPFGDFHLPVVAAKRNVAVTEMTDVLPARMPMTIFADNGFHLRVRDGRVLLLMESIATSDAPNVENEWIESVRQEADARVPSIRDLPIDRAASYSGFYEMTPDRHAILGPCPGCDNLFFVNGSSGHGVMHSPALGQLMAEIICDGVASSMDVSALRPTRFAERCPNESASRL